jgi:hypothetical protein
VKTHAIGTTTRLRVRLNILFALTAAAVLSSVSVPAPAQTPVDEELPARVARVAEFAGDIFLATEARANEWTPVGLNYPVTSGDNLWVGGDGRAEIDYGGGQFRMGGDTNLNVSRLDDRQLVLFAAQGRLVVRVRVLGAGDGARIDTPNAQIRLMRPGLYRIDVPPDRATTTVSVREGEALIAFAGGLQQALPGQSMVLEGPEPEFADMRNSMPRDAFDAWSANRDRYYEGGPAGGYVSPEMVGYADLDHYGAWESYPEYGSVWFPTDVPPGWAPYSDGYWTSVGGWGNTWVDAAPWGYAPSHYGRWVWFGRRWGWCPGRVPAHPAWAPAMVAWIGGNAWGASLGSGGPVYGWVPLGWREPMQPWWRGCGERCWSRYNRPYSVAVPYAQRRSGSAQTYVNATVPGALSAVAGATLAERKPVAPNRIALPPRAADSAPMLADAPPVRTSPAIMPARSSTRALPAPASTFRPTAQIDRLPAVPGAQPARQQPAASVTPATPAEGRARTPTAVVGGTPASAAPVGSAPAMPSRGITYSVPGQPATKDTNARTNAPSATADERSGARSEPLRSVPVPVTRPAPSEGIAMPPPRTEPSRSVPVTPTAAVPAAGIPMPAPRPVPAPAPVAHTDAPTHAAPAAQVNTPQGTVPASIPAAQTDGRAAAAPRSREAKDAPAPAGQTTQAAPATPATPAAPAGSAR